MTMFKKCAQIFTITLALALTVSACTKRVDTHGNIVKQSQLDRILIGKHTQRDVASILGSPSATGTFNQKRWYYFTEKSAVHSMGDNGSDGDEDDVFSDGLRRDQESDY